jgi:phosphate-selective porin OprO/OprP
MYVTIVIYVVKLFFHFDYHRASHQNAFAGDDLDNGFQFESKPEIHLATDFLDTGRFTADFANLINPEMAIVYGPFSLQTEYTFADINHKRSTIGSNDFTGFYVYGSYFITGENRSYKTTNGTFSRVKPKSNFKWGKRYGCN